MPVAYASDVKRKTLLRCAKDLLHEQGYARTTLADVAKRSHIPLGNVYYYFKTKQAIGLAVLLSHELDLRAMFAAISAEHMDPVMRLRALIASPIGHAKRISQFGCPHGGLCHELRKLGKGSELAKAAQRMMRAYVDFAETLLRAAGLSQRDASDRALELIAGMQGAMLLSNALGSEPLLARQLRRLESVMTEWIPAARRIRN